MLSLENISLLELNFPIHQDLFSSFQLYLFLLKCEDGAPTVP